VSGEISFLQRRNSQEIPLPADLERKGRHFKFYFGFYSSRRGDPCNDFLQEMAVLEKLQISGSIDRAHNFDDLDDAIQDYTRC
jgi:hypothetical protein